VARARTAVTAAGALMRAINLLNPRRFIPYVLY
jgi:hypothetical protein